MSSNHDKWIFVFNTLYPPMDARKHTHTHSLCDHLAVSPINFNYKLFGNCDLVCFSFWHTFFVSLFWSPWNQSRRVERAGHGMCHFILSTGHFIMVWMDLYLLGLHNKKTIFCTMNLCLNWWATKREKNEKISAKCAYVLPLRCLPFSALYQNTPLFSHLSSFPLSHFSRLGVLFVFYFEKTKMGPIENEHISTETFGI